MNKKYIIEELAQIDVSLDKIMRNAGRKYFVQDIATEIREHSNNLRKNIVGAEEIGSDKVEPVLNEEKKYIAPLDDIIKAVTGCIYYLAPNHKPRNMEAIVTAFIDKLKAHKDVNRVCPSTYVRYYLDGTQSEIMGVIREVLFDILEFRQLNLSDREYLMGVDVDDETKRHSISFVSRYGDPLDGTDDDFIDLDAVIQNIDITLFGPYCEVNPNEHS